MALKQLFKNKKTDMLRRHGSCESAEFVLEENKKARVSKICGNRKRKGYPIVSMYDKQRVTSTLKIELNLFSSFLIQ